MYEMNMKIIKNKIKKNTKKNCKKLGLFFELNDGNVEVF